MEFDEIPRFWYSHIACDAWIDFSSRTIELRQSERRENLLFFYSLSLSLSVCFFLSLLSCFLSLFPPLHFLYLLNSFTHVCSHLIFSFSLFFFRFSFIFLFSFFFSSLTFLFLLFDFFQPNLSKWGKLPPTFLLATCHLHVFSGFFLIFFFLLYYIIQHMAQCEPFIPRHGSCHVSLP